MSDPDPNEHDEQGKRHGDALEEAVQDDPEETEE